MSQRHIAVVMALAHAWPIQASAADLSLSLKPEFLTGDYGTGTRTRLWQTPFEVKLHEGGHGIGLRLPYILETGNQPVVPGLGPVGDASARSFRRQGLGNLRMSAWTRLWEDVDSGATLGAMVRITPPAIRHVQPMGVSFTRMGLELNASVPLPHRFAVDLSIGRRLIIGAPGFGLHDYWYGTVDVARDLDDAWTVGLTIDAQSPSSAQATAILEIGPWIEYAIAPGWRIGAYLFRGFTRDSADWGGGFTLTHRFAI